MQNAAGSFCLNGSKMTSFLKFFLQYFAFVLVQRSRPFSFHPLILEMLPSGYWVAKNNISVLRVLVFLLHCITLYTFLKNSYNTPYWWLPLQFLVFFVFYIVVFIIYFPCSSLPILFLLQFIHNIFSPHSELFNMIPIIMSDDRDSQSVLTSLSENAGQEVLIQPLDLY